MEYLLNKIHIFILTQEYIFMAQSSVHHLRQLPFQSPCLQLSEESPIWGFLFSFQVYLPDPFFMARIIQNVLTSLGVIYLPTIVALLISYFFFIFFVLISNQSEQQKNHGEMF